MTATRGSDSLFEDHYKDINMIAHYLSLSSSKFTQMEAYFKAHSAAGSFSVGSKAIARSDYVEIKKLIGGFLSSLFAQNQSLPFASVLLSKVLSYRGNYAKGTHSIVMEAGEKLSTRLLHDHEAMAPFTEDYPEDNASLRASNGTFVTADKIGRAHV